MTAWDLSTAEYVAYVSIITNTPNCYKVRLNNDGTKLYLLDYQNDSIDQYSMSTPYDLTTLAYVQTKAHGNETNPTGMWFKPDGTKCYILGYTQDRVYQMPLSTPWDISTLGASEANFSISAQDSASYGVDFNDSGTKMWVSGSTNKKWFQYTLATPFSVATASYDNKFLATTDYGNKTPLGVSWNTDGTKCYLVSDDALNHLTIYQCTCSPFDISTAVYDNVCLDTNAYENVKGIFFTSDGTKLFCAGNGNDRVVAYNLPASSSWSGKINGINYSAIAKINGIAKASISKINGVDVTP